MVTYKEKNFISAVIYVHNNQDTIDYFLKKISEVLAENFEKFEIICVNDNSTDESIKIIKTASNALSGCVLSIVNMSFYQGKEAAMNAGTDLAIGDFVFEFDNNIVDYNLSMVMDVYNHSIKGHDIVAASNSGKRLTSNLFYMLFNRGSNTQYKLGSETFRVLSRRAINRIQIMSKTIPYRKALYANCGLKFNTMKYKPVALYKISDSKQQHRMRQDTALSALILFTDTAYKLTIYMTGLMMLTTLGGVIYTIVVYISNRPVAGYTTTMLILSGGFFGVFAILAIIVKYLSILVDLVFKRQKYILESIEKISS